MFAQALPSSLTFSPACVARRREGSEMSAVRHSDRRRSTRRSSRVVSEEVRGAKHSRLEHTRSRSIRSVSRAS
jgi:hypothetical protein